MPRPARPLLLSCLLVLVAAPAVAGPFRYATAAIVGAADSGGDDRLVRFEGTSGTFEPGSTFSLGRFVVEPRESGPDTTFGDVPFAIELRVPDLDESIPASPPTAPFLTRIDSGVLIRGRLSGVIGPLASELVADYEDVDLGGLGPYTLGHVQRFSFPIPVADLVLPSGQLPPSDDDPSDPGLYAADVRIRAVPEPATWAAWGLIGCGALLVRRRHRA